MVSFSSIEQVLAQIQQQPGWEQYLQYYQVVQCWQKTVNKTTSQYTRLLYIKKEVLWVATSSSARAQELTFQRYSLLKKLNSQLPFSLKDIRFSTSQWNDKIKPNQQQYDSGIVNKNKKYETNLNSQVNIKRSPVEKAKNVNSKSLISQAKEDPQAVIQRWIELAKVRSNSLESCPQCASPTPEVELKRWNLCHHCIAKKWFIEYRSPT